MVDIIRKEELTQILDVIVEVMEGAKDELIELDGAMGDGDLGLTMVKGFSAVAEEIRTIDETDMGKIMMKLGMKMNSTVPSTMGTLVSICFLKAAPAAKGKTELTLVDMVAMGKGAVAGVMDRGKSNPAIRRCLMRCIPPWRHSPRRQRQVTPSQMPGKRRMKQRVTVSNRRSPCSPSTDAPHIIRRNPSVDRIPEQPR